MNKNQRLNLIANIMTDTAVITDIGNNIYNLTITNIPYRNVFYDSLKDLKITPIKDGILIYRNGNRNIATIQKVKDFVVNKDNNDTIIDILSVDFTYNDLNVFGVVIEPILKDIIHYNDSIGLVFSYIQKNILDNFMTKYREFQYSDRTYHMIKAEDISILVNDTDTKKSLLPYITVLYCTCKVQYCTCKAIESAEEISYIKNAIAHIYGK